MITALVVVPPETMVEAASAIPLPNRGAIAASPATQFDRSDHVLVQLGQRDLHRGSWVETRAIDQSGDGVPDGVLQNTVVPGMLSTGTISGFMRTSMCSSLMSRVLPRWW